MKKYLLFLTLISIYSLFSPDQIQEYLSQDRSDPFIGDFEVTNSEDNLCDFIQPQIGVDSLGDFIIVWIDTSNGISKICCKQFDYNGVCYFDNTLVTANQDEKISSPKLATKKKIFCFGLVITK